MKKFDIFSLVFWILEVSLCYLNTPTKLIVALVLLVFIL